MKNIKVKLKTEHGTFEIGEINLNPHVIGEVSDNMLRQVYPSDDTVGTIVQLGGFAVECGSWVYLYQFYTDSQIDFYFVESGYLYNTENGVYHTEIEIVGEKIIADDLKTAYTKFTEKVNERW